ncbi:MAG: hypothetical protein BroJett018_44050 [Chloroflexota bacterium]|nr:hypothetical protein [Chloroflexota bacterium]NOG65223.1 hypothetical protein [Chloroflexota bacterium]GIK66611.1 MAG: hypothetical protein BroJett018_44050 [Chloroflexota bacterium]
MSNPIEVLEKIAINKAQSYAERPDTVAVAITGSIGRGMTWEGSDVDLWVYRNGERAFEDGWEQGIYWEADIESATLLDIQMDDHTWLRPHTLEGDEISLLEALWGCRVYYDPTGKLTSLKKVIDSRVAHKRWMRHRAELFISYGRGCLAGLQYADALTAILMARVVATDYGITAYWMRRGKLLTSALRVPERLADEPELQRLYCEVFGLKGKVGADEFLENLKHLPMQIQDAIEGDVEECKPAMALGYHDGVIRHLRQIMAADFQPEEILPILALGDDLETQKGELLEKVGVILDLCEAL